VKLNISSDTKDADLFVILRVFQSDMKEVTFRGALDPHTPVASLSPHPAQALWTVRVLAPQVSPAPQEPGAVPHPVASSQVASQQG